LLYLRLDPLHEHLLLRAGVEKWVENDADKKRYQYDRNTKVVIRDGLIEKNKEIEDRPVKDLLIEIEHGFLFCFGECFYNFCFKLFSCKTIDARLDYYKDITSPRRVQRKCRARLPLPKIPFYRSSVDRFSHHYPDPYAFPEIPLCF